MLCNIFLFQEKKPVIVTKYLLNEQSEVLKIIYITLMLFIIKIVYDENIRYCIYNINIWKLFIINKLYNK